MPERDGWLDPAKYEHIPILGCTGPGTMIDDSSWKFVGHTVEARPGVIDALRALMQAKPCYCPQFGMDPLASLRRHQYIPWTWSGAALKGGSECGMETNRWRSVQVEIVDFAKNSPNWGDGVLWQIGDLIADLVKDGCPINLSVEAIPNYDAMTGTTATEHAPQRLYGDDFRRFNSIGAHILVGCPTPETPILCADLVWRPAGDLLLGDELIAFDEESPGAKLRGGRRFRTTTVEENLLVPKSCVRIVTDRAEVTCSTDHLWLTHTGVRSYPWAWKRADEIQPEDEIGFFCEPWATDTSNEAGWLAGLYDADGCLVVANAQGDRASQNWQLAFDQLTGELLTEYDAAMLRRGFEPKHYDRPAPYSAEYPRISPMESRRIQDRKTVMRALGTLRPRRLLRHPHLRSMWEGAVVGKIATRARVQSVERVGMRDVCAIQTGTRTYIAAGMLSHNCNSHYDWHRANAYRIGEHARNILAGGGVVITTPTPTPPPAIPAPPAARPEVLTPGMSGGLIQFAQQLLIGLGYDVGPAGDDGIYGNATADAVRQLQRDAGFTGGDVDGIIGPHTQAVIAQRYGNGPGVPPAARAPWPGRWLLVQRPLQVGADVWAVQAKLALLGYDIGPQGVDTVYGNDTANAVFNFQVVEGLKADHVCGRITWDALAALD